MASEVLAPEVLVPDGWRPSRRRLTEALRAALAPVVACLVVLGGLVVWTDSGAAGGPVRIEVTSARMLLPYGNGRESAVYFRITNSGRTDDQLTGVTSDAVDGAMLARNTRTDGNAGYMRHLDSVTVPAGRTLAMSPQGVDVMVTVREAVRVGDVVPFVLHFRQSGRVEASAVVVEAGSG
ncbi:copper chaperone PCu(A)C [Streptomyces sp. NA04227]|uniref:copper chaperone PCu(A)C n=1 Tax=Streptomyces sp. NA04227 TaxID=2742136 RepID=UPI0020CA6459|nr:copper chaperone PCu(A)C [Streptomyces sp. NA04227]